MSQSLDAIKKYVRAANYISATQIYLKNNFLLKETLTQDDIKPRLLGHWGTCPGINFVYAHLNNLIVKEEAEILFVLGSGHGFPALQANLFMEGTLGKYYDEAMSTERGLSYVVKNFSWPYGFPSHSNPGTPGVILEGGELGYSLSTSYGAILDNPNLIVACMIGDGEAETGPTATAWHLNKFIDPKTNGAVLPILHLNGYKISGPTIFGRMSDEELHDLFSGYGYEPIFVSGDDEELHEQMEQKLSEAYTQIRDIQTRSRIDNEEIIAPKFPMIILKTLKGWGGIKEIDGEKFEGNFASHQVVAEKAKTDAHHFELVKNWFESYNFEELFDPRTGFSDEIKSLLPKIGLRMGDNQKVFGGVATKKLILPKISNFFIDKENEKILGTKASSMLVLGEYLNDIFVLNKEQRNFRFFSPDETYSNKLNAIFKSTSRPFVWRKEEWDEDMERDGRCLEMLSEHSLQGLLQGYILTGRHGIFASYEAFIQIVASMVDQYAKFLKASKEISWRKDIPSLNYILTSSSWRQDHNGFSHQNPSFISNLLHKKGDFVHVYFPPDANSTLLVAEKCLSSRNEINVIVAGKTMEPQWLTRELAEKELKQGLMTWDFASDENPDIILSSAGDYLTKEMLATIDIVKKEAPQIKIRYVNIVELSTFGIGNADFSSHLEFSHFFTKDKPVIFSFHGYPETLKQMLYDEDDIKRFSVYGYNESGSTTTPFDMHIRNGTSRYQIAQEVFIKMEEQNIIDKTLAENLIQKYNNKIHEHNEYIKEHGVDPEEIENWTWNR